MSADSRLNQEQLFGVLLDAAVDAVVVIDDAGVIREANAACVDVFGYRRQQLVGENVRMLMNPEDAGEHDGHILRYLETGESNIIGIGREVLGKRRDGTTVPLHLSVGEAGFEGRRYFVGILRDLSERDQLNQLLQEQQAELKQTMDSALVPTGLLDCNFRLLEANGALREFLGTEDVVGRSITEFAADSTNVLSTLLEQAFSTAGATITGECVFGRARSGRTADVYLASFQAENASTLRGVLQCIDRTAERKARETARDAQSKLALYQRQQTLGVMTSSIAHEINQPMGAISNYTEAGLLLLQEDPVLTHKLERILRQIAKQAERASGVIDRLRGVTETTEISDHELTQPVEILEDAIRLSRPMFEPVRVELRPTEDGAELPPVAVDPLQMRQVLINLVQNAAQAMQSCENPRVVLAASQVKEGILFSVKDFGTGIADEVAQKIVQPALSGTLIDGMSMGLAICRSIIENHVGRFWFENNEGEPGATFFVLLPRAPNGSPSGD